MTHDRSQYSIIEISISEMTKTPLPISTLKLTHTVKRN